ncbi:hypothetical protein [Thalassospira indica]|nr:hypothetical protein [Thalassospira indica]
MPISLKQQNVLLLAPLIIVHVLTMAAWANFHPIWAGDLLATLHSKHSISTAALSGIAATILTGIIPAEVKSIFVFWRIKHPLPGCRAFSVHIKNDARISEKTWKARLGEFPVEPKDQNATWYRIYSSVRDAPSVKSVHKNYLFCRDLTAINLIFLVLSVPVGAYFLDTVEEQALTTSTYLAIYFFVALAAQNYGKRMVTTVFATAQEQ